MNVNVLVKYCAIWKSANGFIVGPQSKKKLICHFPHVPCAAPCNLHPSHTIALDLFVAGYPPKRGKSVQKD